MKKILIVDVGEVYGGIEKYIYNIYTHIKHDNFLIDFLIFSKHCAYEDVYLDRSNIYSITSRRTNPLKHITDMRNFFREHKYDYVWVQTCSASNITVHKMAKRYTNAVIVSHAHVAKAEPKGYIHDCVTNLLHLYNRRIINKLTDVHLACSKEAAKYLFGEKFVCRTKIVNNGIDLATYKISTREASLIRDELHLNDNEIVIGHIGRFSKVKNHNLIVRIFQEFNKKYSRSKLLLVGEGTERSHIENKVHELGISNNVIFTGSRNDIPQLLSVMNAFLFPSFNEGFGIVVIEAQAAKVPVLLSDSLSSELIVSDSCRMLSISSPIGVWVDELIKLCNKKDYQLYNSIQDYDIGVTTKEIEKVFGGEE